MVQKFRYLSHPQVIIDPTKDIRKWSLSEVGKNRVRNLASSRALGGTETIISSAETKALETAKPLARAFGCRHDIREQMHENDRSSTGFLPQAEFEAVADQFFAKPEVSIRGWETARMAQQRIVAEIQRCLLSSGDGDILFVGHGGVGTLLYCSLNGIPINRAHDQGPGGGFYFEFTSQEASEWRPMENLIA